MARFVFPVVVLVALVGGYVAGQQPQQAAPLTERALDPLPRRCVGVSAVQGVGHRHVVYRAFEDGTVEVLDSQGGGPWKRFGK